MAEENSGTWTDFFKDSVGTILEVGLPALLDGDDNETKQQQIAEQYTEKTPPIDNVQPISGGSFAITKEQVMIGTGLLLTVVIVAVLVRK